MVYGGDSEGVDGDRLETFNLTNLVETSDIKHSLNLDRLNIPVGFYDRFHDQSLIDSSEEGLEIFTIENDGDGKIEVDKAVGDIEDRVEEENDTDLGTSENYVFESKGTFELDEVTMNAFRKSEAVDSDSSNLARSISVEEPIQVEEGDTIEINIYQEENPEDDIDDAKIEVELNGTEVMSDFAGYTNIRLGDEEWYAYAQGVDWTNDDVGEKHLEWLEVVSGDETDIAIKKLGISGVLEHETGIKTQFFDLSTRGITDSPDEAMAIISANQPNNSTIELEVEDSEGNSVGIDSFNQFVGLSLDSNVVRFNINFKNSNQEDKIILNDWLIGFK